MSRQEIRVAFTPIRPWVNDCPKFPTLRSNEKCPFPGFCAELLHRITQRLNLTVVPVTAPYGVGQHIVGSYNNGTWQGMLGYLANGTADTTCVFLTETPLRNQYFEFSADVYTVEAAFAVGRRRDLIANGLFDLLCPYPPMIWAFMMFSLLLTQFTAVLIAKSEKLMGLQPFFKPIEVTWQILRLQLLQNPMLPLRSASGRVLFLVFAFMQCLLLFSLYQGLVLSALISRKHEAPFENDQQFLAKLAKGGARVVIRDTGHWFFEAIMTSNDTKLTRIRESLTRHPIVYTHTTKELLDLIESDDNYVLPAAMDDLLIVTADRCDTVIVKSEIGKTSARFPFPKGSRFTALFDKAITEERLEIQRLYRRYEELPYEIKRRRCAEERDTTLKTHPMQITPFLGVFIVGLVGLLFSLVAFSVEQACLWLVTKFRSYVRTRFEEFAVNMKRHSLVQA